MALKTNKRERGQGLVEYALILVLVAVVVIGVLAVMGPSVSNVYCSVIGGLNRTGSCTGAASSSGGTLTAAQSGGATQNQARWNISYNGTLTDGLVGNFSCTGSTGTILVQAAGSGQYVITNQTNFHGTYSCTVTDNGASASFGGSYL